MLKNYQISIAQLILATYSFQPVRAYSCPRGSHYINGHCDNYSCYPGKCESNDSCCKDFNITSGDCQKCKWNCGLDEDSQQGNHCTWTWWWTILFIVLIFFGVLGLALFCCCCIVCCQAKPKKQKSYSRKQGMNNYFINNTPGKVTLDDNRPQDTSSSNSSDSPRGMRESQMVQYGNTKPQHYIPPPTYPQNNQYNPNGHYNQPTIGYNQNTIGGNGYQQPQNWGNPQWQS